MFWRNYSIKRYTTNNRIRAEKVRLINKSGENVGVVDTRDALQEARKDKLDLILIAENANPPVAKILDFKKFLYEEKKKEAQSKAKSKKSELKEFRFGPTIGEGDLQMRIKRTKGFLENGDRVRITVQMRGREQAHPELAYEKIERFASELEEIAKLEKTPERKGNRVQGVFVKK